MVNDQRDHVVFRDPQSGRYICPVGVVRRPNVDSESWVPVFVSNLCLLFVKLHKFLSFSQPDFPGKFLGIGGALD